MVKFIGKRLAYAVLTLFLITTATFFLVAGAPGDPIAAKVGQMPEQAQQIIREKYGLDQPVVKRYTTYMKNLLTTGDFGESIIYTGQSANDIIKNNTLVSAKIGLLGLLFQTTIGICLGMVAALNRGKPVDHVIRVLVVLAICVPSFVFASVLQYFLAFKWKLVPVFGWGQMKHYILPVACICDRRYRILYKIYEKQYLICYRRRLYYYSKSKGMYKEESCTETCFEKCNASYHYYDRTFSGRNFCRIIHP